MNVKEFFKTMLGGALMGVAMIIPGVSGGTVAVLLGMYNRLIESVSGIKKHFKSSVAFLLPLLTGAAAAFAAMFIPLGFALERAPFPTVMLFAGLMAGSLPNLIKSGLARGFGKINILSVLLPIALIVAMCVANICLTAGEADLSQNMSAGGWFALAGVAMLASCALVIPGVSGSMVLMLLGYYAPLLGLAHALTQNFWHVALVAAVFGLGLLAGFFTIAKIMKLFLTKFPRGTNWAITGFVLGSIPAIFIIFDYAGSPMGAGHILAGVVLCALGAAATYFLTAYVRKHKD